MDLMDLLKGAGGDAGIGAISKSLGLSSGDTGSLLKALAPAMTRGFQRQSESSDGLAGLAAALQKGSHQRYIDDPAALVTEETRSDGNKILGHLFGSKDVSRNVAAHAAKETGISSSLIKKALPFVASLVMGAMSKKSDSGRNLVDSAGSVLGPLAGMFSSKGDDGFGIDDVLNIARKLF